MLAATVSLRRSSVAAGVRFHAVARAKAKLAKASRFSSRIHYPVVPKDDHGPYQEYSVIHTDRSLNLMSQPFGTVMRDLNAILKHTYQASATAIIPGSGTFGMEAVARQFVAGQHALVIRNGWFSYRWTEILDMASGMALGPNTTHTVCKATSMASNTDNAHYQPVAVHAVCAQIKSERPAVVFMPHVETSTGMMLPDSYIAQVAQAVHDVNGLLVLDCIASGTVWVDMKATGVDVLISAPQKGWTGAPCAALVMMSDRAVDKMAAQAPNAESSFSLSLKRWSAIMEAYDKGGFAYHTTMPTDALRDFHQVTVETVDIGLDELKQRQVQLGRLARDMVERKGLDSVAAPGFQAPGVLVYYSPSQTDNPTMMQAFHQQGLQIAMGVPWKLDEPAGLKTFRIGLFGLDKLNDMDRTVHTLEQALDAVLQHTGHVVPTTTTRPSVAA